MSKDDDKKLNNQIATPEFWVKPKEYVIADEEEKDDLEISDGRKDIIFSDSEELLKAIIAGDQQQAVKIIRDVTNTIIKKDSKFVQNDELEKAKIDDFKKKIDNFKNSALQKISWVNFEDKSTSERIRKFTTPFKLAIEQNQIEVVMELIKMAASLYKGRLIDKLDINVILSVAAIENISLRETKYLAKNFAYLPKQHKDWDPLFYCVCLGRADLARVFINKYNVNYELGGDKNTGLILAIEYDSGALREKYQEIASPNYNSETAIAIIETFLEKGADVNLQDKYGKSALMNAAYRDSKKIVSYLIDNAKIDNWDLVAHFDHEVVKNRICPNKNPLQKSILSLLVENGDWVNATKLMEKNADVNRVVGGYPILFWAIGVKPDNGDKIKFIESAIYKHNADINKTDCEKNALMVATGLRKDDFMFKAIQNCIENQHKIEIHKSEKNLIDKDNKEGVKSPPSSQPSKFSLSALFGSKDLSATK
jgi:ankyrin repeat protein